MDSVRNGGPQDFVPALAYRRARHYKWPRREVRSLDAAGRDAVDALIGMI